MKYLISILFLTFISGCSTISSRMKECSKVCSSTNMKEYVEEDYKCGCK